MRTIKLKESNLKKIINKIINTPQYLQEAKKYRHNGNLRIMSRQRRIVCKHLI